MPKQKTYKYIIELSAPMFPRHLADSISMVEHLHRVLVSVTDMQRDDHWQGMKQSATYQVQDDEELEKEQL
jgi:hypothetical protein